MTSAGMFDLTGKTALVTGGNSGLGLAFATGIARCGGDIVIWGRSADRNEEAAEQLRSHGVRVRCQQVDVADEAQVVDGMAAAAREIGRLDCVIANAGSLTKPGAFHEMTTEQYDELLAVAQHGAFFTLREACRHMVDPDRAGEQGGSLIATGSLSVLQGFPRIQHYAAAKSAVMGMMRGIAVEYGDRGIRANMVAAGYFETTLGDIDEAGLRERHAKFRGKTPMARNGGLQDLEGIAAYLMSDAASFHTGDVIVIDGGLSMGATAS